MLSKAEMVARKGFESLYENTCDVVVRSSEYNPETFRNEVRETFICKNQPCRISFGSQSVCDKNMVTTSENKVKLFVAPEVDIPDSSKVIVSINGEELIFEKSTEPFIYKTHREYVLTYSSRVN